MRQQSRVGHKGLITKVHKAVLGNDRGRVCGYRRFAVQLHALVTGTRGVRPPRGPGGRGNAEWSSYGFLVALGNLDAAVCELFEKWATTSCCA